jgi:seryl-tRNA synthetase
MTQGMHVPEPLRRYMIGSPEFIPYTKELSKHSTSAKESRKANPGQAEGVAQKMEQVKI